MVQLSVSAVSAERQCASPSSEVPSEVPSEVSEAPSPSPEVSASVDEMGTSCLEVGDYVTVHSSKLSSRMLSCCGVL